jgi:hypothetical protein
MLEHDVFDLIQVRGRRDTDDTRARNHDLGGGQLGEGERPARDLADVLVQRSRLGGFIHEIAELGR